MHEAVTKFYIIMSRKRLYKCYNLFYIIMSRKHLYKCYNLFYIIMSRKRLYKCYNLFDVFQPPPPGVAPNAAQLAAMQGHTVIGTQQRSNFWTGGSGGGYTMGGL
jgi:hypothetical protein